MPSRVDTPRLIGLSGRRPAPASDHLSRLSRDKCSLARGRGQRRGGGGRTRESGRRERAVSARSPGIGTFRHAPTVASLTLRVSRVSATRRACAERVRAMNKPGNSRSLRTLLGSVAAIGALAAGGARVGRGRHQRGGVRRRGRRRLRRADEHRRGPGRHRRLRDQGQRRRQRLHDPGRPRCIAAGGYYVADVDGRAASAWARTTRRGCSRPADLVTPIDSYSWTSHAAATYGRCPNGTGADDGSTSSSTRGAANDLPGPGARLAGKRRDRDRRRLERVRRQPQRAGLPAVRLGRPRGAVGGAQRPVHALPADLRRHEVDARHRQRLGHRQAAALPERRRRAGRRGRDARRRRRRTGSTSPPSATTSGAARHEPPRGPALRRLVRGCHADRDQGVEPDRGPARPGRQRRPGGRHLGAGRRARRQGLPRRGHGRDVQPGRPTPTTARACSSSASSRTASIIAYALNQTAGAFTRVATIASGFPKVMELNTSPRPPTCGRSATTAATAAPRRWTSHSRARTPDASSSPTPTSVPPAWPNLNNEGFAIAPQAECVGGLKPVFWSDDSNTGGHALRTGKLNCTPLPDAARSPDPDADPHADADAGAASRRPPPRRPRRSIAPPRSSSSRSSSPSRAPTPSAAPASSASSITLSERADLTITATARKNAKARARTILTDDAQGRRRGQAHVHADPEAQASARRCARARR